MKNFNSNAFFKVCSGVALVVFAAAAFCFSIKPAQATPTTSNMLLSKSMMPAGAGKYQFMYNAGVDGTNAFYHIIVIGNTETGAVKSFIWDRDTQKFDEFLGALPSIP